MVLFYVFTFIFFVLWIALDRGYHVRRWGQSLLSEYPSILRLSYYFQRRIVLTAFSLVDHILQLEFIHMFIKFRFSNKQNEWNIVKWWLRHHIKVCCFAGIAIGWSIKWSYAIWYFTLHIENQDFQAGTLSFQYKRKLWQCLRSFKAKILVRTSKYNTCSGRHWNAL